MKRTLRSSSTWLVILAYLLCGLSAAGHPVLAQKRGSTNAKRAFGTITGSVRDARGVPLAGALVAVLRDGADEVLKQVRSERDGSFSAQIAPGRYTLRAIADGFSAAVFPSIEVRAANELVYRFNLEPVGSGRTAPERRKDRDDPKWTIRAARNQRSIFQMQDDDAEPTEVTDAAASMEPSVDVIAVAAPQVITDPAKPKARTQGIIETYVAASTDQFAPAYAGLNFAIAQPASDGVDLLFAGQIGAGRNAPQRLETAARMRATNRHTINVSIGASRLAIVSPARAMPNDNDNELNQIALRAVDEWTMRNGVVLVFGLDYARFIGAGNGASASPRLGVQYDANARTRLRAAYAPGGMETATQSFAKFEGDAPVAFTQAAAKFVPLNQNRAQMERSRRLEFGVERVLDNTSSVDATIFFDTTAGRSLGLLGAPVLAFADTGANASSAPSLMDVVAQQGTARGLRLVYARRLNKRLSASAGYSFGYGQRLADPSISNPADFLTDNYFQTAALQMLADLGNGTRVNAVWRFSPATAVFAIDPFAGRLAIYDPSLNVAVTQDLPTFGLPVRAEAVIDARNLLDAQTSIGDSRMELQRTLAGVPRRSVRGGVCVRF